MTIRWPKTTARQVDPSQVGANLSARLVYPGETEVCILAIGKMVEYAEEAAATLAAEGIIPTLWDGLAIRPTWRLDGRARRLGNHHFPASHFCTLARSLGQLAPKRRAPKAS